MPKREGSCGSRGSQDELPHTYLTFVAGKWACPIADIAAAWLSRLTRKSGARHLTPDDRAAASAICLLLAVMVESYTVRVAVDQRERPTRFRADDWWTKSGYQHKESVLDLLVLRDAIAHNHIYVGPKDVRIPAEISRTALGYLKSSGQRVGPTELSWARRGNAKNLWQLLDQVTDRALAARRWPVDSSSPHRDMRCSARTRSQADAHMRAGVTAQALSSLRARRSASASP